MSSGWIDLKGIPVPRFLYGTAWKEERTQEFTIQALRQGFRGIDTANQRRHYYEAAVGRGLSQAIAEGIVTRDELFIQTKFTFKPGQDHRLPYDPAAPVHTQVEQSLASSLDHLGISMVDSYVLHGPTLREGLTADDWSAWRAMEEIQERGEARLLGISNVTLQQLELLCKTARVPPSFVQNRCFAVLGWDRAVRRFCREQGIVYQGFSLLTANPQALAHGTLVAIARHHSKSVNQVVFRFALDAGMIALTGTTDAHHMREDLAVLEFKLEADEVQQIEQVVMR